MSWRSWLWLLRLVKMRGLCKRGNQSLTATGSSVKSRAQKLTHFLVCFNMSTTILTCITSLFPAAYQESKTSGRQELRPDPRAAQHQLSGTHPKQTAASLGKSGISCLTHRCVYNQFFMLSGIETHSRFMALKLRLHQGCAPLLFRAWAAPGVLRR